MRLFYKDPAADWERESLAIGNGRLGASLFGEVAVDRILLNEKSLWTGGPGSVNDGHAYGYGFWETHRPNAIRSIRERLARDGVVEPKWMVEQLGQPDWGFGNYQPFGELFIELHRSVSDVADYRRELDISTAVSTVSYTVSGKRYQRSYFASHPDGVVVIHLEGYDTEPVLRFDSPHADVRISRDSDRLTIGGSLQDNGLRYSGQFRIRREGPDAWTILFAAATDYAADYPLYRSGDDPSDFATGRVDTAFAKPYSDLLDRHVADHRELFDRVTLNVGGKLPANVPTSRLLLSYGKNNGNEDANQSEIDRGLEALYFQYGRYLLIASSRPGTLPANLQGVWNASTAPPWSSDYHVNINLQMNYWPAEVTNLADVTPPLFAFIRSMLPAGREAARQIYDARGWTIGNQTNVFGFNGLRNHPTSFWFPEANAWLCRHAWEHYLFGLDESFLRETAYPLMAETCLFWLDFLVEDASDGTLVVSPSYSPEHGQVTNGASMAQQLVWDLLDSTIAASEILDADPALRTQLKETRDRLDPGLRVGSWGQLQEWKADLDDPEDEHRHVSHLFALHPGAQISPLETPSYAEAAKISLRGRGDGGTGWSKAWKVNFWARLLEGDHAHLMLSEQLIHSTLPNLWDTHPPFQIDGNFGATAGIAEMLLQSHTGAIHVLPALPSAWPSGSVKGLRARGGYTVDIEWADGRATSVTLHATRQGKARVVVGDQDHTLELAAGESRSL